MFYFADVLGRNTDISSGYVKQERSNIIYRDIGQDNFTIRLPDALYIKTPSFKGVKLAVSYSKPSEGNVDRDF
ncbi:MAG: hypothetical protein ACL7BU_13955 [Candidatus Phlomobacter fragariae]